uniref:Methyltransferase domain-containing protein n=1 Tax=Eutreptiella gymnastica TaxID=73025 RepID=A0A7S4GGK9_9EUGL
MSRLLTLKWSCQLNHHQTPLHPLCIGVDPLFACGTAMAQLFEQQVTLFKDILDQRPQTYDQCAIVEVGMGTAELFLKIAGSVDTVVGVEPSQPMIDLAFELHGELKELSGSKVHLVQGNAVELCDVIERSVYPKEHAFWSEKTLRLSCMCMNTFGILPGDALKDAALRQMFLCAGAGGLVIVGCWHSESLPQGYKEFYRHHPELCGPCSEKDFDYEKGNFRSETGYESHWWSKEELETIVKRNFPWALEGLRLRFEVRGLGIFAICEIVQTVSC